MKFLRFKKNTAGFESERKVRDQYPHSTHVYSYYSKRNVDNKPKIPSDSVRQAKSLLGKSKWIRYLPSFLSLALICSALLYISTLSTKPRIIILNSSQENTLVQPKSVYESSTQRILDKSIFNKSKLTIDTDNVAKELEHAFPELEEIIVTIPLFGRKPLIKAQPAPPSLVLLGQNKTYVVDTNGVAIGFADQLTSSVKDRLPSVTYNIEEDITLREHILPNAVVSFIETLHLQFTAQELQVESYNLPPLTNEIHVRMKGESYYLKLNSDSDPEQQIGAYLTLVDYLKTQNIRPREYVDLRVEERVFYK